VGVGGGLGGAALGLTPPATRLGLFVVHGAPP
jgi:hypothetical protein